MEQIPDHIVVIGAGDGELAPMIAERHPDIDVTEYIAFPDLVNCYRDPAVEYVTTAEGWVRRHEDVMRRRNGKVQLLGLVNRGYGELARFQTGVVSWTHKKLIGDEHEDLRRQVVSARGAQATANLWQHGWFTDLQGAAKGGTAVIVAQGPGLSLELVDLAQRQGAIIMCAAQAVSRLNDAGLVPDMVFVTDPTDLVTRQLKPDAKFGVLLVDTMTDPALAERYRGRMYYYHLVSAHMQHVAWTRLGLPTYYEAWTTVTETMLALSEVLEVSTVLMTGVDYSGRERERSMGGTGKAWRCQGNDGDLWWTNPHYYSGSQWAGWFARISAMRAGVRHYRFSDGLEIRGIQQLSAYKAHEAAEPMLTDIKRCPIPLPHPHPEARQTLRGVLVEAAQMTQGIYRAGGRAYLTREDAEATGLDVVQLAGPPRVGPKVSSEIPDMRELDLHARREILLGLADQLGGGTHADVRSTMRGLRT